MVSQIIEIGAIVAELIGMVIRPDNLHHHHIIWNVWNIEVLVAVVGLSAFGVVIFLLLLFQMYFISLNITTCTANVM